jgi:ankyrin repeat protein
MSYGFDDKLQGIFITAIENNDSEAVQQALRDGANLNFYGCYGGDDTPLLLACEEGHSPIVRILLDAGADTKCTDERGRTAVHHACEAGHLTVDGRPNVDPSRP